MRGTRNTMVDLLAADRQSAKSPHHPALEDGVLAATRWATMTLWVLLNGEHYAALNVFRANIPVATDTKSVVQQTRGHADSLRYKGRLHNPLWDKHVHTFFGILVAAHPTATPRDRPVAKTAPRQPKWHAWADWLIAKIAARPDIYLRELQAELKRERGEDVCLGTICAACRALEQSRKKRR